MPGSSFVAHRTQANEQSRGAGPRAGQINFDLPVAKSAAFQALYPVRPPGRVRRGVRGSGLFLAIAIREENASVPRGDEPELGQYAVIREAVLTNIHRQTREKTE